MINNREAFLKWQMNEIAVMVGKIEEVGSTIVAICDEDMPVERKRNLVKQALVQYEKVMKEGDMWARDPEVNAAVVDFKTSAMAYALEVLNGSLI